MPDPVEDLLRRTPTTDAMRAAAWEAYESSRTEDELAEKIGGLSIPESAKAELWDLKAAQATPDTPVAAPAPIAPAAESPSTVYGAIGHAARGAGAGLASTIFHGGDLIRRGLGMERVIDRPEVQAVMTPPDSLAGNIGFYGEQGAEFMAPLSAVSKATRGMALIPRMAAEATGGAAVAGLQSGGDTGPMTGAGVIGAALPAVGAVARPVLRGVQRAAAGASEGGIGGAIAGAIRTAAPGQPYSLLIQALKPRSTRTNFHGALDRAIPELKAAEGAIGRPIATIDDLLEATKAAKAGIQAQLNELRGTQRAIGAEVDLTPVADAMTRSIPKKVQLESPAAAERLRQTADAYRGRFTLDETETLLRETNAELDGFYAMYPQAQRNALTANPAAAALESQARALRTALYAQLDAPGQGAAARELNRRYGALLEVEGEAFRRSNVAKRQQPESLSEQIGAVRAAGDYARGTWRLLHGDLSGAADIAAASAGRAAGSAIKNAQTTDALIRRAFASYRGQRVPVVMPPAREVRGLLPRGSLITPPPADPSFARAVPAVPALAGRPRTLPPHRPVLITPPPAIPPSGGAGVRAAPQTYEMVQAKKGAPYKIKTTSYSSDPNAVVAPHVQLDPLQGYALRWIQQDMEALPFSKRNFNDPGVRRGGDLEVSGGAAGAAIYRAIVGAEGRELIKATRADVIKAIRELQAGKLTKLGELILDVADDLAQGRGKVQRLMATGPPGP